jgi:site-specific DNA-cytosine methylase
VFFVGHLGGECRPKVFPIGKGNEGVVQDGKDNPRQTYSWALRGRDYKDGTNFIRTNKPDTQKGGNKPNHTNIIRRTPYSNDMRIRRLTPTECERLQGFPDGWTEGVSDTQRYKVLGNAVTVNVVQAIMEKLL